MPRIPINPLMYANLWKDLFLITPGLAVINMPKGVYQVVVRGSGGAGGNNDSAGTRKGGAGGKGLLNSGFVTISESTTADVYVGNQGKTYANGGNGGAKGDNTDAPVNAGNGGGGGEPSYFKTNTTLIAANGGGGGGGAGGSDTSSSRYSDGGSGGGGGGYYRIDANANITSVAGKKGEKGKVVT